MAIQIKQPFEMFFNKDGSPLNDGNVYIGIAGLNPETNPISIFSDPSMTIPVAQPLKTTNGYISINGSARDIFAQGDYSITVKDKNGLLMYHSLTNNTDNTIIGTIAILRTTVYSGQQIVSVTGYYTAADDIGVREYYWDAVSVEADNGGTIIQVTGVVTGRWKMKYSGAVNVKWFGAKGDVITDNTLIYTSMINSLPSGSKIEWDSNGVYYGDFIVNNKSFNLQGNGCTLKPKDLFGIKFDGTLGTYSSLSLAPTFGDTSLLGATVSTDDLVILYSGNLRPSDSQAVNYEIVKIKDGASSSLYDTIYSNQNGGTPKYAIITSKIDGLIIDNFNIDAGELAVNGVYVRYSTNAKITRIKMAGGTGTTVSVNFSYNYTVDKIQRIKPSMTGSGQGYNVAYYCGKYANTDSIYGESVRHEYDLDSVYVSKCNKIISLSCVSAIADIAHNGFGGYCDIGEINSFLCNSSIINASGQGASDLNTLLFRNFKVSSIVGTNTIPRNIDSYYVGVHFQYPSSNITIDNITINNVSPTVFNYPSSIFNNLYQCIRFYSPINNTEIKNASANVATNILYIDNIKSVTTSISISNVQAEYFVSVVTVGAITLVAGSLTLSNISFTDTALIHGNSIVRILSTSNKLSKLMLYGLLNIPLYMNTVEYSNNLVGIPTSSSIDTAGHLRRLGSLNAISAGSTISQYDILTKGNIAIWGSTTKSLSATEPFARPIARGMTFGILNYGAGTLTIPANSQTVDNTVDLVLAAGKYYEFIPDSNGNKWTLARVQTGMTIS